VRGDGGRRGSDPSSGSGRERNDAIESFATRRQTRESSGEDGSVHAKAPLRAPTASNGLQRPRPHDAQTELDGLSSDSPLGTSNHQGFGRASRGSKGQTRLVGDAHPAVRSSCLQGRKSAASREALGLTIWTGVSRRKTAGGPRALRHDAVETPRALRRACKCSRAAYEALGLPRRQGVKRFGGASRRRARRAKENPRSACRVKETGKATRGANRQEGEKP
jgi:hypothetical protein